MDVIGALAYPMPVTVIAQLLGVPLEDRDRFAHWSHEIVRVVGYATLEEIRRSNEALREFNAYLSDLAEQRRREPQDDLMSALLAAEEAGGRLSREEVLLTCRMLLNTGHLTTTHLIGNGLHALLRHPEQLDALRRDPALIQSAVEERSCCATTRRCR
jgi:cytochrome P450